MLMITIEHMSQDARRDEELATERRAQILAVQYLNTTQIDKLLFNDILTVEEMYRLRVVPIQADRSNILFGVTTTTSQQTMNELLKRFTDQRIAFTLISDTGYREYMMRYDPPKQVVYQDIAVNNAGSEELVNQVSITLKQVRATDMLAYLVSQAHHLNASDIHVETQASDARVRFRIDGVLHPVARLELATQTGRAPRPSRAQHHTFLLCASLILVEF